MKNGSSANPFMGSLDAVVCSMYLGSTVLSAFPSTENWSSGRITEVLGLMAFAGLFGVTSVAMFMGWRSRWVLQYGAVMGVAMDSGVGFRSWRPSVASVIAQKLG